ncbi:MAG: polyprenyl synthetase family protein [Alphaproteobacteria bacterium]|nr:polyprenyl synthetase family protein [Alphaproteobacteria bacterium]
MRYAALHQGKAFRAYLCLQVAQLLGAAAPQAERVATAIEAAHCYSLIHDDLPAMDDDDMRRGQPSVHIAYDEATAILAGNGLLSFAFAVLADSATHPKAETRTLLVAELAQAVGAQGMVQGQMLDIEGNADDIGALARLHSLKTGALIRYAVRSGVHLGGGDDDDALEALTQYANAIGLAYQIADDVMDADDNSNDDRANFATLLGVVEARHEARHLVERACKHISVFGERGEALHHAALFVIERKN